MANNSDVTLLTSLIRYIEDVKPYHTKLKDYVSELVFEDSFNVNVTDDHSIRLFHQNVWGRDDHGGYRLTKLCDSINGDRFFRIPAALWPRFTTTDRINQYPPGDVMAGPFQTPGPNGPPNHWSSPSTESIFVDVSWVMPDQVITLTANVAKILELIPLGTVPDIYEWSVLQDGIDLEIIGPNDQDTFQVKSDTLGCATVRLTIIDSNGGTTVTDNRLIFAPKSSTSFMGSDGDPKDPTKFAVPFHQGSRVYINGRQLEYSTEYIVDTTRSFIKLLFNPEPTDRINVQLFKADRLFVAYNLPFDLNVDSGFDLYPFDLLPIDVRDELTTEKDRDLFQFTIDLAHPDGHTGVLFYNSSIRNTPKARLTVTQLTPEVVDGETWYVKAITPWKFIVTRSSDPDAFWYGDFRTQFEHPAVSFVIDREWSDYYLVPDDNSYDALDVDSFDAYTFIGTQDNSDPLLDLTLTSAHGTNGIPPVELVMSGDADVGGGFDVEPFDLTSSQFDYPDPYYREPMKLGKIKQLTQPGVDGTPQPYYAFVLNDIPVRGTYVELRVEQNGQLNPWINATFQEDWYLEVEWVHEEEVPLPSPFDMYHFDEYGYDEQPGFIIPAGARKIIHYLSIGAETIYQETVPVNQLVLYHGRSAYPKNVIITPVDTGIAIALPIQELEYFQLAELPFELVACDRSRVVVNLSIATAYTVQMMF